MKGERKNKKNNKKKSYTTLGQKCYLQSVFVLGTLSSLKYFHFHCCCCLLPFLFRFLLHVHIRLPHAHWARPAFKNLQPNVFYSKSTHWEKTGGLARVLPGTHKGLKNSYWDSFNFCLLARALPIREAHAVFSRGLCLTP